MADSFPSDSVKEIGFSSLNYTQQGSTDLRCALNGDSVGLGGAASNSKLIQRGVSYWCSS